MKQFKCQKCNHTWDKNQLPAMIQNKIRLGYYCPNCQSFELQDTSRKTRDCWRFYCNYGQGWEHEITEYTKAAMIENKKAYQENSPYPLRIVKGRERIEKE